MAERHLHPRPTIRKLAEAVWVKHFLACSRGVFESRSTFLTQFVASKTVYLFDLVVVDVFDMFCICSLCVRSCFQFVSIFCYTCVQPFVDNLSIIFQHVFDVVFDPSVMFQPLFDLVFDLFSILSTLLDLRSTLFSTFC